MVQVGLLGLAVPHAETQVYTGDLLGVPGEVLAAARLQGGPDAVRAEHVGHGHGGERGAHGVVHHGRHALHVVDLDADAPRRGELLDGLGHQRRGGGPHVAVGAAQGAPELGGVGDDVRGGAAGVDVAPGHDGAGARVEAPVDDAGDPDDDLRERVDGVLRLVGARGVPAVGAQVDADLGVGRGDRPGGHAGLAHAPVRIAVQGDDPVDAGDDALLDAVLGAARHGLLGGLEDQPDGPGRRIGDEHRGRAEQHRGVGVVPARVADPGGLRGERLARLLGHGQGVDVRAQGHHVVAGRVRGGRHVAPEPGPEVEAVYLEAHRLELGRDVRGGGGLLEGELGVLVDVPAPRRHPALEIGHDLGGHGPT